MLKHWIEMKEIMYYPRYIGGILIIFKQCKITKDDIHRKMNNFCRSLKFKPVYMKNMKE